MLTAGLAAAPLLLAGDSPKVGYSTGKTGAWSASAHGTPQAPATEPGPAEFTVRIFDGDGRIGPAYGRNGELMATDVTSEVETCADGNTRISALRIGSWRYQLDGDCDDGPRSTRITVKDGGRTIEQSTEKEAASSGSRVMHCDPATWSCSSKTE